MVVYSDGKYDVWDLLISVVGLSFSGGYLYKKVFFDLGSKILASLILSLSVVVLVNSLISLDFAINYSFVGVLALTVVVTVVASKLPSA